MLIIVLVDIELIVSISIVLVIGRLFPIPDSWDFSWFFAVIVALLTLQLAALRWWEWRQPSLGASEPTDIRQ